MADALYALAVRGDIVTRLEQLRSRCLEGVGVEVTSLVSETPWHVGGGVVALEVDVF